MIKFFYNITIITFLFLLACSGNKDAVFTGVIEGKVVQVPALTGGEIKQLLVETGDQVEAGQILAITDTLELIYQRQQLDALLDEINSQEQLARTNLARTKNDLKYIEEKYKRFSELLKKETVAQQAVDDVENRYKSAQSAYETAQQQFATISAKKKQNQAKIKSLNKKITDATVISPLSGIISNKYYEEGEAIPPLAPLVEIIGLDEVWVKVYISEKRLPYVKTDQEANIFIDGLDKELSGRISWISPKAEFSPKTILTPETRTSLVYAVKILIKNKDHILKHGMPVEIEL
jgi:HlyD family secretion protein